MGARIRLIAVLFALIALVLLESGPAARSLDVARVSRVPSGILFVRAASEEPAAAANANAEDEDDEEEDDSGPKAAPRKAGAKPEAPRRTATWGEFLSTIPWNKFYLDFVALGLVVIYYLNSFRGSSANEKIAKNWYKLTSNVWREQFAVLGDKDGNTLMSDGPRDLIFYATGRENVRKVTGFFRMLPRHDLFFYIYEAIYRGDHDKFIVEFELPKDATDDLVWALLHKRLSASIISSKALDQKALRTDLALPKQRSHANMPRDHYLHLTESPEVTDAVFSNAEFVATLKSLVDDSAMRLAPGGIWMEDLSVSDVPREAVETAEAFEKNYRKIVTMTIRIPSSVSSADESAVTKIMEALVRIPLMLIDILAASKGIMSSDTKSKIREAREKERKKFSKAEEQKRMEELRKRKLEAKKAELAMMNPKDRAKQEEKDAERERKKRAKAGKQRVVMA